MKSLKLVKIELKDDDLLFYASFIRRLGGKKKAREHLLDIINRYFRDEYIRPIFDD